MIKVYQVGSNWIVAVLSINFNNTFKKNNNIIKQDFEILKIYKNEVEDLLQWGEGQEWRHQDFAALSTKIFDKTKIQLSISTLKRLWGKIPYNSLPNTHTLNTLAQFLEYENWLAYKKAIMIKQDASPKKKSVFINFKTKPNLFKYGMVISSLIVSIFLILSVYIFSKQNRKQSDEILDSVKFSVAPISSGLPNTVVFQYDVSEISSKNIQIQQNRDSLKRFNISNKKFEASSIYYYPGYWCAGLLIDGEIVREQGIYITTEGWVTMIADEPIPRYLQKEDMAFDGTHNVKESLLKKIIYNSSSPNIMSHSFVSKFKDLSADNFGFGASFRNFFKYENGICKNTRISIKCTNGDISIPFSVPSCVGRLQLLFSEVEQNGSDFDFSNFGVDYSVWNTFKCKVEDKTVKLFLNDNLIHKLRYQTSLGEVVGVSFDFIGAGAIDNVYFKNKIGTVVYEEEFNSESYFMISRE